MKFFTKEQLRKLKRNGDKNYQDGEQHDFKPVVKLFFPWGSATWLLTEIDTQDETIAFGLCDLGMGEPEIGRVSLTELSETFGPRGLRVERDLYFKANKTLSEYAEEARRLGWIKTW